MSTTLPVPTAVAASARGSGRRADLDAAGTRERAASGCPVPLPRPLICALSAVLALGGCSAPPASGAPFPVDLGDGSGSALAYHFAVPLRCAGHPAAAFPFVTHARPSAW